MIRNCAMLIAGVSIACSPGAVAEAAHVTSIATDIRALLAAARGAPEMVCSLAADAIGQGGWYGGHFSAPRMPLPPVNLGNDGDRRADPADVQLLLDNLSSPDRCVRSLAVRVLGHFGGDDATRGLTAKLTDGDASVRETAALGLGLIEPKNVTLALVGALKDVTAGVRANTAWALGRVEDGRALQPLIGALGDADSTVRDAVVGALGKLDSTSAIPALLRVLREDKVASVRRTAAWALGNLEAQSASKDLSR